MVLIVDKSKNVNIQGFYDHPINLLKYAEYKNVSR
jgi:hypothetical protein